MCIELRVLSQRLHQATRCDLRRSAVSPVLTIQRIAGGNGGHCWKVSVIRATGSIRQGLIPRSTYSASCRRRNGFPTSMAEMGPHGKPQKPEPSQIRDATLAAILSMPT